MASFLSGIGGLLGGLIGGGGGAGNFLGNLANKGMNFMSGIAGKVFKPITSLLKPVGNTLSKWAGADYARE